MAERDRGYPRRLLRKITGAATAALAPVALGCIPVNAAEIHKPPAVVMHKDDLSFKSVAIKAAGEVLSLADQPPGQPLLSQIANSGENDGVHVVRDVEFKVPIAPDEDMGDETIEAQTSCTIDSHGQVKHVAYVIFQTKPIAHPDQILTIDLEKDGSLTSYNPGTGDSGIVEYTPSSLNLLIQTIYSEVNSKLPT